MTKAKAKKEDTKAVVKVSKVEVVKGAVEAVKGLKSLAGASVIKSTVQEGNRVVFRLDNGYEVKVRVKAKRAK